MIKSFNGKTPRIARSAFVSETAYVIGDVEIGENSGVWPGAVVRGDLGIIKIGNGTFIEDNCVLHSGSPISDANDLIIGDSVVIGHGAIINCCRIGNNILIGTNSVILHDAEISDFCIIGAGCLIVQGMKIPDNSLVTGVPGKIKNKLSPQQLCWIQEGSQTYKKLVEQYREQGL